MKERLVLVAVELVPMCSKNESRVCRKCSMHLGVAETLHVKIVSKPRSDLGKAAVSAAKVKRERNDRAGYNPTTHAAASLQEYCPWLNSEGPAQLSLIDVRRTRSDWQLLFTSQFTPEFVEQLRV